jgi:hypothetical protein
VHLYDFTGAYARLTSPNPSQAFAQGPGHRAGALLACQLERTAASGKLTRQGRSIEYVKGAEGHGEQKLRQSARLGLKELFSI